MNNTIESKHEMLAVCKQLGIETDLTKRWEQGLPHHPKSIETMKGLMAVDMALGNDYFCWKKGGDGDNGECLMYELDILFALQDAGHEVSEHAWR
jgi:hypothetical protein